MELKKIENLICQHLPDAIVNAFDLTGGGDHFGLEITSKEFEGKRLLQQHRMVMDILKVEFQGDLHAVQIKTKTPSKS